MPAPDARRARPAARVGARLRGAGIWLALAGLLAGAGVSTAGRVVGTRRHQRDVAAALHEYARYAALAVADGWQRGARELHERILRPGAGVPSLDALDARARLVLDDEGIDTRALGTFRIRDGAVEARGAGARAIERALLDTLCADRGAGGIQATDVDARGSALHVAWTCDRRDGAGVVLPRAAWERRLGARAASRVALLPPSLSRLESMHAPDVVHGRADTLLALTVRDARGRVRWTDGRAAAAATAGEARVGGGGDTVVVRAALSPALAARIVAYHWHLGEDLGWDVGIPLVMLGSLVAAVLLVRRERQLARARQEFVASVSHELRTPLAQVRAIAETLRLGRARSDAERDRWLGVIDREARRLGDLVENIILYSHLERAEFRVRREPVDLSALVEEGARAYEPFVASRRARLAVEVAPGIAAHADPHAVHQVLVNLLDNALKYGPPGQTVIVALSRVDGRARLTVSDAGPGVPMADRERIWRPFTRLDGASSAAGTGLGLAVVRALARQHGGDAWVEEAVGGGAAFVVEWGE